MRRGFGEKCIRSAAAFVLAGGLFLQTGLSAWADTTTIDVSSGEVSSPSGSGDVEEAPEDSSAGDRTGSDQGSGSSSAPYSPQMSSTGRQLQAAQQEKNRMEDKLNQAEEAIGDLNEEKSDLGEYLKQVSIKLQTAVTTLNEYEDLVDQKERDIEEAEKNVELARELQVKRKKDMKGRIKYMYEQGSESYLDILLGAKSFSDFLNKSAYFESINQYDRKMLDVYTKAEKEISEQEKDLKAEKEALEVLRTEAQEKAMQVSEDVASASASMKEYADEIARKEEEAYAYEKQLAEKENDIASLQAEYKKELALSLESQSLVSRDLSDLTFASGDLDLMAAMIECEAGGESYTGKVAVGAVILNRVRSPRFPSSVIEVLMQNRQFAPVASGRFSLVLARGANESCYQAARDAMSGASPVGGCLFFRTPIPGLTGQQIGGHIFY